MLIVNAERALLQIEKLRQFLRQFFVCKDINQHLKILKMETLMQVYAGMTIGTANGTVTEWYCAKTHELICIQSSVPEGCEWVA